MGNVIQINTKKDYLMNHTEKIKATLKTISKDFMYISFLLYEIKEYGYYESEGYSDVYEYAAKELALGKTQTKQYIRLHENYCERTKSNIPTMHLAKQYQEFGLDQLIEMLSLPVEERIKIKPDMSQKEIREVKRSLKKKDENGGRLTDQISLENILSSLTNENELRCDNCGEIFAVDPENRKQWIQLMNKKVGPCCYKVKWDTELLMREKE